MGRISGCIGGCSADRADFTAWNRLHRLGASTVSIGQTHKCYGFGQNDPYGNGAGTLRTANLAVVDDNGEGDVGDPPYPNRYTLIQNSSWQILSSGDSGGPCFDASGVLAGVHSTSAPGGVYESAEQTKMSYVSKWVRNTILGCNPDVEINCP